MSSDLRYLSLDDLLALTVDLGVGPVRDFGLLDSAAHRPQSEYFGTDSYPTVALKAAALPHLLVKNHALIDGNKRLAWHSAVVFADLNGFEPKLTVDQAYELVMAAAQGQIDVAEISERLQLRAKRQTN